MHWLLGKYIKFKNLLTQIVKNKNQQEGIQDFTVVFLFR